MRYLSRTHRASISWLNEVYKVGNFCFKYKKTDEMAADIFTQAYANPVEWLAALKLISIDATTVAQTPLPTEKNSRPPTPQIQHHAHACALSFAFHAMATQPSASRRLIAAGFKVEGVVAKAAKAPSGVIPAGGVSVPKTPSGVTPASVGPVARTPAGMAILSSMTSTTETASGIAAPSGVTPAGVAGPQAQDPRGAGTEARIAGLSGVTPASQADLREAVITAITNNPGKGPGKGTGKGGEPARFRRFRRLLRGRHVRLRCRPKMASSSKGYGSRSPEKEYG